MASVITLFGLALAAPLACGSTRDPLGTERPSFSGPDAGEVDAPTCGYRCSRDLKKVLKTCEGQSDLVQAECPPDQGCGIDRCVSACEAAALSKGYPWDVDSGRSRLMIPTTADLASRR